MMKDGNDLNQSIDVIELDFDESSGKRGEVANKEAEKEHKELKKSKKESGKGSKTHETSEQFEVESIIEHQVKVQRKTGKELKFFIKWLGWDHSFNEWISETDMHCDEMIRQYFRNKDVDEYKLRSIMHECSTGMSISFPLFGSAEDYRSKIRQNVIEELGTLQYNVEDVAETNSIMNNRLSYHLSKLFHKIEIQNSTDNAIIDDCRSFLLQNEYLTMRDENACDSSYKCDCLNGECNEKCSCHNSVHRPDLSCDAFEKLLTYVTCGTACSCGGKCNNTERKILDGSRVMTLQIERFIDNYWCLVSTKSISPGTIICEIFGRVYEESFLADRVRKLGMEVGMGKTISFCDIDGKGYILDMATKGSYARYIQHSCVPNSSLVRILHSNRPASLYVVSIKSIKPNTLITMNMFSSRKLKLLLTCGISTTSKKLPNMPIICKCERRNCVKKIAYLNRKFFI